MASHTITAMFKSRADAQSAVEALQREIGLTSVRVMPDVDMTGSTAGASHEDKGFFSSLRDMFVPDEDSPTYAEGVRRGDVLVTASVEESKATRVMDLLEQHGAIDLDAQERTWRENGWMPAATGATSASAMTASKPAPMAATTQASMAGRAAELGAGQDETIQLAEERLVVGKRDVSHGRVRIRSYVVETPVSEQVSLHEERVSVERHAVDRAATGGEDLFRERTIEATERSEEAVIAKEARVREEVVLHKEATDRNQTVTDTVRRTEIEVEGDDSAKARFASGNMTSTTAAPVTTPVTTPVTPAKSPL